MWVKILLMPRYERIANKVKKVYNESEGKRKAITIAKIQVKYAVARFCVNCSRKKAIISRHWKK